MLVKAIEFLEDKGKRAGKKYIFAPFSVGS